VHVDHAWEREQRILRSCAVAGEIARLFPFGAQRHVVIAQERHFLRREHLADDHVALLVVRALVVVCNLHRNIFLLFARRITRRRRRLDERHR